MRRYSLVLAGLAAVALAASAIPAFSADGGLVQGRVTAALPPAPCLTLNPTSVDYGTLPFEKPSTAATSTGTTVVTAKNCGTAAQNLNAAGTDATGPSGTWNLNGAIAGPTCGSSDVYRLGYYGAGPGSPIHSQNPVYLGTTAAAVKGPDGQPAIFSPSVEVEVNLQIVMPCEGSNGAGEQKSFAITFTALVA